MIFEYIKFLAVGLTDLQIGLLIDFLIVHRDSREIVKQSINSNSYNFLAPKAGQEKIV